MARTLRDCNSHGRETMGPGAVRRAREAHADFMAKPFDIETLEAKVGELLQKAS